MAPVPGSAPVVGVVVAARDAGRWIAATLTSLLGQEHQQWICVVVDDGSTDDTAAVTAGFTADPRISLVTGTGAGAAGARNTGVARLPPEVELVQFLDSDDVLLPDALRVLVAALTARPDAVGAYGLADYIDDRGRQVHPGLHPRRQSDRRRVHAGRLLPLAPPSDSDFQDLVVGNPVWPAAVALHRRSVVTRLGGMFEGLRQLEDWDLYLRMSRQGPFVSVPHVVAHYRRHDANLTRDTLANTVAREVVMRRAWTAPENSPAQRRAVAVATAWRRVSDARAALTLVKVSAHDRDRGGVTRATAGLLWTLALLPLPPSRRPRERRVRWSRGLSSSSTWAG